MRRPTEAEIISSFLKACQHVERRGLLQCSSGNMSWRLDSTRMLVSRTRSWLCQLTPEDVAICAIADGSSLNGVPPTVEVRFHAGILRKRPEVNVVLHYQAPFSTTLACREQLGIDYNVIPELPFYIGPIGHVPFLMPGTEVLADAVIAEMTTHELAQMSNHGQVVVAPDFPQALERAEFFELACRIIVMSGSYVEPIPPRFVKELSGQGKRI